MIIDILTNPFILVPFITWAIAQITKFVVYAAKGELDFKYLIASGGMPSVHSAVVSSLVLTALVIDGPKSSLFGLSALVAGIVIYDSFGVRRSSGETAMAFNRLIAEMTERHQLSGDYGRIKAYLGHKPVEVLAGVIYGWVIGAIILSDQINLDFSVLVGQAGIYHVAAFGGLFLVSLAVAVLEIRKLKKIKKVDKTVAVRLLRYMVILPSLGGLALEALQFQKAATVSARFISYLVLALVAAGHYFYFRSKSKILVVPVVDVEAVRKQKWLPKKKKRK